MKVICVLVTISHMMNSMNKRYSLAIAYVFKVNYRIGAKIANTTTRQYFIHDYKYF